MALTRGREQRGADITRTASKQRPVAAGDAEFRSERRTVRAITRLTNLPPCFFWTFGRLETSTTPPHPRVGGCACACPLGWGGGCLFAPELCITCNHWTLFRSRLCDVCIPVVRRLPRSLLDAHNNVCFYCFQNGNRIESEHWSERFQEPNRWRGGIHLGFRSGP